MATAGTPYERDRVPSPMGGAPGTAVARMTPISETRLASLLQRPGERSGFNGAWFPPNDPMQPQAPPDTKGRRWDYPTGWNLRYTPGQAGQAGGVDFAMLRRMADPSLGGLDILRLAIETRKSQMKAQQFKIVGREKNDDGGPRARELEALLQRPDGVNRWRVWLGMLLEDHFVIDAPTIYYRESPRGMLLEQIDGATISLLIDSNGRTPMAPLPAYQQILHGIPSIDYTVDEMGYYLDNLRPGRVYGMSHVQQVVGIVTIALNRQLSVLNYYTAGSVPDMIMGLPATWNIDAVQEFQEWWDSLLSGNLAARRHARFVPGDVKPVETKTEMLKSEFDEWLARVVMFCFSLSAQPFVKEVNRATAETAKESAAEEGLEGTKLFVKDVIDDALLRMGEAGLQLQWDDEEIVDAKVKAEVILSYYGGSTGTAKPILTLDEARERAGLPPATAAQRLELQPPVPDPLELPGDGAPDDDPGAPKPGADAPKPADPAPNVSKAAHGGGRRSLPPLRPNRKGRDRVERGIRTVARRAIKSQRRAVLAALAERADKVAKAAVSEDDVRALIRAIDATPWDDAAREKLRTLLAQLAKERSTAALARVAQSAGVVDEAYAAMLHQANEKAVAWAQDRVGNLITDVDETTRDVINELSANAIEEGLTNDQLATRIEDAYGFSDERAIMIARTETAEAESQGALRGYQESGAVVGTEWSPDDGACEICLGNADAGVVPLGETYPSGDDAPPAHPNCECVLLPVVDESLFADPGAEAE